MCANEEIGQHASLAAAPRAIALERFAGQKRGEARNFLDLEADRVEDALDFLIRRKPIDSSEYTTGF
jgi:hypothetical protein